MFKNTYKSIKCKCKKKDYTNYICDTKLFNYECIICLNEIDRGQSLTLLKCGHIYHKSCLEMWFYKKRVCPLCDIEIKP